MDGWVREWTDGWTDGWRDARGDGESGWMDDGLENPFQKSPLSGGRSVSESNAVSVSPLKSLENLIFHPMPQVLRNNNHTIRGLDTHTISKRCDASHSISKYTSI